MPTERPLARAHRPNRRPPYFGASQVVLDTDHPIPWEEHPVHHVFATTTLSDKQKAAILGGNAARLFGMKEA